MARENVACIDAEEKSECHERHGQHKVAVSETIEFLLDVSFHSVATAKVKVAMYPLVRIYLIVLRQTTFYAVVAVAHNVDSSGTSALCPPHGPPFARTVF